MMLSTDIWVAALIRRAELAGAFATVARKGDARAGAVVVRTRRLEDGACRLFVSATGPEGDTVWIQPLREAGEAELDAYAERARRIDPDIWVVEIEDRQGRHFLTEPVAQEG